VLPRAIYEILVKAGFQTVEQLADIVGNNNTELPTELKAWPKKAKQHLDAAGSTQAQVAALTERVEKAETYARHLEDKLEMMVRNAATGSPMDRGIN